MNKFEIKMDNGDIFIVEGYWTIKEIVEAVHNSNVNERFISAENEILRLKHIVSIKLIGVTL